MGFLQIVQNCGSSHVHKRKRVHWWICAEVKSGAFLLMLKNFIVFFLCSLSLALCVLSIAQCGNVILAFTMVKYLFIYGKKNKILKIEWYFFTF